MPIQGQHRKAAMKQLRQDDMRERIRSSTLLTDIIDLIAEMGDDATAQRHAEVRTKRSVVEMKFKLLNKVLPELKATELDLGDNLPTFILDMKGYSTDKIDDDSS